MKAQCIDSSDSDGGYLTIMKIYEVVGVTPDYYKLEEDDIGVNWFYSKDRFIIIEEE